MDPVLGVGIVRHIFQNGTTHGTLKLLGHEKSEVTEFNNDDDDSDEGANIHQEWNLLHYE